MSVTIPLVLVLAVLAWVAWQYLGLRAWQAVVCLLLGFLLAGTSVDPILMRVLILIVRSLTGR